MDGNRPIDPKEFMVVSQAGMLNGFTISPFPLLVLNGLT